MTGMIKILYVDDEPINLILFDRIFGKKYAIRAADSGMKGLEILNEDRDVKIVISDMRMPHMNGLQFISKARESHPDLIYFILTGYEISKEITDALEQKIIDRYFQKPFKLEEISGAIINATKKGF
jgi:two-component system, response regulator, stage 0 sporulation protein F